MSNKFKLMLLCTFAFVLSCCVNISAKENIKKVDVPKNIVVIRHTNTSLKIKWKKDKDADGYIIYRYKKASNGYVEVKRLDNDKSYWINKGLKRNTVYKYKIRGYKNVDGQINLGELSYWVSGKTYNRHNKKINAKTVKVGSKQVNIGLCSFKKMKARVIPSKYGTNDNKEAFNRKIRWYSSDESIATVNGKGKIQAKSKSGKCYVYAVAHNGKKTRIAIYVKNYARVGTFENLPEYDDIICLLTDYKGYMQDIAEYYSINRLKGNETIRYSLNKDAIVEVSPINTNFQEIKTSIETLLVSYPYYIDVEVYSDSVEFIVRKRDTTDSLPGIVTFYFDNDCSRWSDIRIASHWDAVRFRPEYL